MALNFAATSNDYIDLGDITAARFSRDAAWTVLAFFRVEELSGNERAIVSKWAASVNSRQFILRVDNAGDGSPIEAFHDGASLLTGGNNVALDTWYLVAVACDGSGGFTEYLLRLSDYTFLDDGVTGSSGTDRSDLTEPVKIGNKGANDDEFDGDIDHVAYLHSELTRHEILCYGQNPEAFVAARPLSDREFYYQLGRGMVVDTTNGEFDLSGNEHGASYNLGGSTAMTAAVGPPVGHRRLGDSFIPAVAGTPVSSSQAQAVESLQGIDSTVAQAVESLQGITSSASEAVESIESVSTSGVEAVESVQGISTSEAEAVESLQGISQSQAEAVESLGQIAVSQSQAQAVESLQGIADSNGEAVESLQSISATIAEAIESIETVAGSGQEAVESLQGVSQSQAEAVESRGGEPVSASSAQAIESLGRIAAAVLEAVESTQTLTPSQGVAVESIESVTSTKAEAVESLQGVSLAVSEAVESLPSPFVSRSQAIAVESRASAGVFSVGLSGGWERPPNPAAWERPPNPESW